MTVWICEVRPTADTDVNNHLRPQFKDRGHKAKIKAEAFKYQGQELGPKAKNKIQARHCGWCHTVR